jgi:thymidylate synthase (FAD)
MEVTLIDKMGTDLTVVNAARVSFDKESSWDVVGYTEEIFPDSRTILEKPINKLKDRDEKLINFLAEHNHWSPFAHPQLQFRIKAPIFVARQLGKSQVGLVWNEVSRRYVDSEPELYFPNKWRKKNPDKKQGSMEDEFVDLDFAENCTVKNVVTSCVDLYKTMLSMGVCAEQARMILPQNMYTEWYWSGSLYAFARVCGLRLKKDTQAETRYVAEEINNAVSTVFPVSWKALTKSK